MTSLLTAACINFQMYNKQCLHTASTIFAHSFNCSFRFCGIHQRMAIVQRNAVLRFTLTKTIAIIDVVV